MKSRARPVVSIEWHVFKWSLMAGIIFWTIVYKLSERGLKVPDFVYVNF